MIVTSKELYKIAQEKNFAIPAANYVDSLSAAAHVEVAEKLGLPLILAFAEAHESYFPFEDGLLIGKFYAENAKVPVVLHLDHGVNKERIFQAIDYGFRSVMIDASSESFEENVRITKEIVEYAHLRGVVVEAEIGHVGQGDEYDDKDSNDNIYTTVEEAKAFVEATGVDSLAISIGTAHGSYKSAATPIIDFDRLREIDAAIDTPLVLHGGSSSGDENLNKCATNGINKVNIHTDLYKSAFKKAKESDCKDYFEEKEAMKQGMQECLEHYYEVFETKKFND
ncbi:class II fructose-bisphosphate aldolase [Intestinibacter sp.]